jgi:hypothetical protein
MQLLVQRLQSMLGIRLSEAAAQKVTRGELLADADVVDLCPRVRYTSTVPYQEGVAFYQQAQGKTGAEADALLKVAAEKFGQALQAQTGGYRILAHWGILLVERARLAHTAGDTVARDTLLEAATEKFAEAMRARRNYTYALSHWGEALQWWASLRAEEGNGEAATQFR